MNIEDLVIVEDLLGADSGPRIGAFIIRNAVVRIPTRAELVEALGGRPVVVMGGLTPAFYPADEDDEAGVFVVALKEPC